MSKRSSSRRSKRGNANGEEPVVVEERALPEAMRQRNRAVAEREASRLARPEKRKVGTLGHAAKSKSAVASTPSGFHRDSNNTAVEDDENQEWCGPFSVARQVRERNKYVCPKLDADNEPLTCHYYYY